MVAKLFIDRPGLNGISLVNYISSLTANSIDEVIIKEILNDESTVKISNVKYKDKIENIRAKYRIRTLKLPTVLFDKIPKNKEGLIFKEVKINNFEMLLNTHIKLLLDKNVQINIISKNLGFYKLTDFENRYNFLLPQNLDNDFQIL